MKRIFLSLCAALLLLTNLTFSQESAPSVSPDATPKRICSTMEMDAAARSANPDMGTLEDFESWLAPLVERYKTENTGTRAVTTIPIIFHVIHNGGADNISATYINAQITQLNNDFRKIAGTSGSNSNPVGVDTEVEFCPATVDPTGATLAEPGINRINRSTAGFSAPPYSDTYVENTIKGATYWDPDSYCNIWVCNLSGGILGYAQFPSQSGLSGLNSNGGGASTDGVVITYTSVGSTTNPFPGAAPYNEGRTLTHELGHWLGLRHIWGDGGCSVDDYCGDTPASDAANYGCPTTHVSCSSTDMVQNYMDYTDDDCMNIYTADQKARIQTVLANSLRRDYSASNGCGSGGGGGGCSATVSSFPYSEGFESGLGAWSQGSGDDADWTRDASGTPSSSTGPSAAAEGSYYMYVEASSPNYPSKVALLNGPCFDLSSASVANFSFQYHMYGAAMGTLQLQASTDGSSWTTVWSLSGNQGNAWASASVSLSGYVGQSELRLRFRGTTGTSYTSDMTVDDLSLTTTTGGGGGSGCTGGIVGADAEGFESSFGNWTQGSGDDFNWTRQSGGTPSSNTGPTGAYAGSFYAYMESSSPNYSTKQAILNGPCYDLTSASSATFSFRYHMYGAAAMGSLDLEISTNGGSSWTSVWNRSGNQGNAWLAADVNLDAYTGGGVQLRFNGVTGTTWQGDMAIDALSLATSGGGGGCTDVTLTLTFDNYPEETSWQILDGATVVASGGTYASQPDGSTLVLNECLDAGCYSFVISDVYGDGICCSYGNGSYLLQAGTTTLASGGTFGASESTNFCVGGAKLTAPTSAETASLKDGLKHHINVFPNPSSGLLNVTFDSKIEGAATIRVTDLMGRQMYVEVASIVEGKNKLQLNFENFPAGAYMISVDNGKARLTRGFVISK